MANIKKTKPVYKRQQFLVAFINALPNGCTMTDLQKLLFLYSKTSNINFYDFIPYKFGSYSFQLAEDVDIMEKAGWISRKENKINYTGHLSSPLFDYTTSDFKTIDSKRGDQLIKMMYNTFPYYAINSEILPRILNDSEINIINETRKQLEKTEQVLFTIGYEGLSVEVYINKLINNDIKLLCDVRNNPLSRKFGFSKNNLKHYLTSIGIEYIHIPELGIVSNKRKNLEGKDDYKTLFKEYETSLSNKRSYLDDIFNVLKTKKRIALTCFEHDPCCCHRHIIRDYLVKQYSLKFEDL